MSSEHNTLHHGDEDDDVHPGNVCFVPMRRTSPGLMKTLVPRRDAIRTLLLFSSCDTGTALLPAAGRGAAHQSSLNTCFGRKLYSGCLCKLTVNLEDGGGTGPPYGAGGGAGEGALVVQRDISDPQGARGQRNHAGAQLSAVLLP